MVAGAGETATELQARTFVLHTAADGMAALAARINLSPQYEAAVTSTDGRLMPLGQATLAVWKTAPRVMHRSELFVCAIYAYGDAHRVCVDVLVRPAVHDGDDRGAMCAPLAIPGLEDRHWSTLAADHVLAYVETLFRAALAPPRRPAPVREVFWRAASPVPRAG